MKIQKEVESRTAILPHLAMPHLEMLVFECSCGVIFSKEKKLTLHLAGTYPRHSYVEVNFYELTTSISTISIFSNPKPGSGKHLWGPYFEKNEAVGTTPRDSRRCEAVIANHFLPWMCMKRYQFP